jgi:hypothetical protein
VLHTCSLCSVTSWEEVVGSGRRGPRWAEEAERGSGEKKIESSDRSSTKVIAILFYDSDSVIGNTTSQSLGSCSH